MFFSYQCQLKIFYDLYLGNVISKNSSTSGMLVFSDIIKPLIAGKGKKQSWGGFILSSFLPADRASGCEFHRYE